MDAAHEPQQDARFPKTLPNAFSKVGLSSFWSWNGDEIGSLKVPFVAHYLWHCISFLTSILASVCQ